MKRDGILGNQSILSSCRRGGGKPREYAITLVPLGQRWECLSNCGYLLVSDKVERARCQKGDLAARVIGVLKTNFSVEVVERSQIGEGFYMNWKEWKKSY